MFRAARTDDQLAAIIGHEIAHVISRHGKELVSHALVTAGGLQALKIILEQRGDEYRLLMAALGLGVQFGVTLPHGRKQESEADTIGLELMAQAGFQPEAAIELWKQMREVSGQGPPEFLSTHPSHRTRIRNLTRMISDVTPTYRTAQEMGRKPECKRMSRSP